MYDLLVGLSFDHSRLEDNVHDFVDHMQSTKGSYNEWRSDAAANCPLLRPWSDLEVYTICQGETSRMMLFGHFVFLLFQNTVLWSIHMRTQDSFWMTSFRRLWHRSSCSSFILKTTTFKYGRSSWWLSSSHEWNPSHMILLKCFIYYFVQSNTTVVLFAIYYTANWSLLHHANLHLRTSCQ